MEIESDAMKKSGFGDGGFIGDFSYGDSQVPEVNHSALRKETDIETQIMQKITQIERYYLLNKVLPALSKGIIEIAKTMPDNPIEALGDYLLNNF